MSKHREPSKNRASAVAPYIPALKNEVLRRVLISELRIPHGPGYRVYYTQEADILAIIFCAGTKKTQDKDIEKAKELKKLL